MKYKEYVSVFKRLCNDLRKRYHTSQKALLEESVSASIEKHLHRINWDGILTINERDYAIILETARSHLRNLLKKQNKTISLDDLDEGNNSQTENEFLLEPSFEEELIIKQIIERVIQVIPDTYRDIASLYLQGYKYKDIAEITGLSEDNIKQRFARLKKWLDKHQKDID